ncbi:hypothetical protein DFH09DRAFT_1087719 [Mycena vulgaris]|nr:hypothetical protein DFH09DRAFT_1087719 [Mycena vulgaris]
MAPKLLAKTFAKSTKTVLDVPEALFDADGNLNPTNSRKEESLRDATENVDMPPVTSVENTEDHALDYGDSDSDDDMEDATLPSGSDSLTEGGTDELYPTFPKAEPTHVSRTDPMRGGGLVQEPVSVKPGRMCAHREVRAMALEGADAEEEKRLLQRINEKKWFLNENLYVPECRGSEFDADLAMDPEEWANLKCDICEEYTRHVGDDFARGEGSLKAVLLLRGLYLVADTRIDNKQAEKSIRELEIANAVAEQLNEDKERQLVAAKAKKSLAVQEIGRLGERLADTKRKLADAWDEVKYLEDKVDELNADVDGLNKVVDELAFPDRPHKKARRQEQESLDTTQSQHEDEPVSVDNREDVVMNGVESATTKEPLDLGQGLAYTHTPVALVDRLTSQTEDRQPPPPSQISTLTILAPPMLDIEPVVHDRGFPEDVATVDVIIKLLSTGKPYYVVFDRTPAQQRAVETFVMHDWFENMLTFIGHESNVYVAALQYYHHLKRDELGYNPTLLAQLIQFREWKDISGFHKPTEPERLYRAQLEKLFIEVFCKPGLYKAMLDKYGATPSAVFTPRHWIKESATAPTRESVVRFFANNGISVNMINDAFEFGQQWVFDALDKVYTPFGWTLEELHDMQHKPSWGAPPHGLYPPATDLWVRRPDLPWLHHPNQFVLTQLSDWQHPKLVGLVRAPDLRIKGIIARGLKRPVPRNLHYLHQVNPFLKDARRQENIAAHNQAEGTGPRNAQTALPAALGNRRTSGMPWGACTQQRAASAASTSYIPVAPSVVNPTYDAPSGSYTTGMQYNLVSCERARKRYILELPIHSLGNVLVSFVCNARSQESLLTPYYSKLDVPILYDAWQGEKDLKTLFRNKILLKSADQKFKSSGRPAISYHTTLSCPLPPWLEAHHTLEDHPSELNATLVDLGTRDLGNHLLSVAPTRTPSPAESSDEFGDFGDSGNSEAMNLSEMDSLLYLEVDSDHDDDNNEADWDEVADEEFQERLLEMILKMEEDHRDVGDDDWIPTREAAEAKRRKPEGRPTEYMKGPDTASKSKRTQQRYAKGNRGQKTLDSFFLQPGTSQPVDAESGEMESPPPSEPSTTPILTAPPTRSPSPAQVIPRTWSASVSDDHSESPPLILVDNSDEEDDDDPNEWDTVLDDMVDAQVPGAAPTTTGSGSSSPPQGAGNVRSWHALREKVKTDLKKRNLSATQHNQLLIIRSFATLRIKGLKRIQASLEIARQWHEGNGNHFARRIQALARHYQVFEELPVETRGGHANAKSLLNDESVQTACLAWLTKQAVGSVTHQKFREGVNSEILTALGITPKKPISERTERCWLVPRVMLGGTQNNLWCKSERL